MFSVIALQRLKFTINRYTIKFTLGIDAIVAGGGGGGGSGNTVYWNPSNTGPLGNLLLPIMLSESFIYHHAFIYSLFTDQL